MWDEAQIVREADSLGVHLTWKEAQLIAERAGIDPGSNIRDMIEAVR